MSELEQRRLTDTARRARDTTNADIEQRAAYTRKTRNATENGEGTPEPPDGGE